VTFCNTLIRYMPVLGAGGAVVAVLRAEKNVKSQGSNRVAEGVYFTEDEIGALECVGQHCGSVLQARVSNFCADVLHRAA
jgi:hypothetical protein